MMSPVASSIMRQASGCQHCGFPFLPSPIVLNWDRALPRSRTKSWICVDSMISTAVEVSTKAKQN